MGGGKQGIRFGKSWVGGGVGAVVLQLYVLLFPLYVTHFRVSYTDKTAGTTGLLVILLFFFYYFAGILLLGAEINAFFAKGINVTPANLAAMVYNLTRHLPTAETDRHELAAPFQRQNEPV